MITSFKSYNEKLTFEYHKKLNPTFWKDEKFDEGVRKKLLRIAKEFYENTGIDLEIKDIYFMGSNANHNYTKYSDLDVHIIVDFKDYKGDEKILKDDIKGLLFEFKTRHHISIRGSDVELYIQDINEKNSSSGVYSLLNDEWIKKPSYTKPNIKSEEVENKYNKIAYEIKELDKLSKQDLSTKEYEDYYEQAKNLKKKIQNMRKEGLETKEAEYSVENLLFKELRNKKMIGKLIDAINLFYDKIFIQ